MIASISIEKAQELMEKVLNDYATALSSKRGLIAFAVDAGAVAGTFNLINELDGFPKEKLDEYRLRIAGIGELNTLNVSR